MPWGSGRALIPLHLLPSLCGRAYLEAQAVHEGLTWQFWGNPWTKAACKCRELDSTAREAPASPVFLTAGSLPRAVERLVHAEGKWQLQYS